MTPADVERLVMRDYPAEQHAEAWSYLRQYGASPDHYEIERVRIAVLRMAGGNLAQLADAVSIAKTDYRDALITGESPRYWSRITELPQLTDAERDKILERDRREYDAWFSRA